MAAAPPAACTFGTFFSVCFVAADSRIRLSCSFSVPFRNRAAISRSLFFSLSFGETSLATSFFAIAFSTVSRCTPTRKSLPSLRQYRTVPVNCSHRHCTCSFAPTWIGIRNRIHAPPGDRFSIRALVFCSVPLWSSHDVSTRIITAVRGSGTFSFTEFLSPFIRSCSQPIHSLGARPGALADGPKHHVQDEGQLTCRPCRYRFAQTCRRARPTMNSCANSPPKINPTRTPSSTITAPSTSSDPSSSSILVGVASPALFSRLFRLACLHGAPRSSLRIIPEAIQCKGLSPTRHKTGALP